MSGRVITTAGRASAPAAPPQGDHRKQAIREARRIIRNPLSTEAEVDDALEAIVELARGA